MAWMTQIAAMRIAVIVLMQRGLRNRLGNADRQKQQNHQQLCQGSSRAGSYQ
jgi:hypothetical protein